MESSTKANRPRPRIRKVAGWTNLSACMEKEMEMPSSRVMRLASSFWAVWDRVFSTPHSRIRLPNMRKPTSATEEGATSPATTDTRMGNRIRIRRDTPSKLPDIRMARSLLVVTSLMAKGWMMGTRAI